MERIKIAAIYADSQQLSGQTVTVCGWARTIRDMKTFGFIELNDGSCFRNLQVVMDANVLDNYKEIAGQNVGAALIVTGDLLVVVQRAGVQHDLEVAEAGAVVELDKAEGLHIPDGAGPAHDGDRLAVQPLPVGENGGNGDAIHRRFLHS